MLLHLLKLESQLNTMDLIQLVTSPNCGIYLSECLEGRSIVIFTINKGTCGQLDILALIDSVLLFLLWFYCHQIYFPAIFSPKHVLINASAWNGLNRKIYQGIRNALLQNQNSHDFVPTHPLFFLSLFLILYLFGYSGNTSYLMFQFMITSEVVTCSDLQHLFTRQYEEYRSTVFNYNKNALVFFHVFDCYTISEGSSFRTNLAWFSQNF